LPVVKTDLHVRAPVTGTWSPEYLAAIVDSSDDAIIGKTLDGVIISWNTGAERLYGYSADEVVGRPISILMPRERPNELPEILDRLRRGERIDHYRTERVRKDGTKLLVSVSISPVHDSDGRIIGASAIARDITAQERAIQEALELREQFVSIASHELRTPLTAVVARLQLVARRLRGPDYDREALQRDVTLVQRSAEKLRHLLERLLDLSRIRSGKLALERKPTDVIALVRAAVAEFAETSGREITIGGTESADGVINIDGVRVEEAVTNLVDNAIKYGPADKPIEVHIAQDANAVRVSVRDHGTGIDPKDRERIFEAFQRANPDSRGVGLGLHIAREIVRLHGGSLEVGDADGGGAMFVMTLPREAAPS
jgi:PAS domain S-box-containing protein